MQCDAGAEGISREGEGIDLKKYLYIVFTRRWVLFTVISIVMAINIIYNFKQIPIYRATSLVLIERPGSSMSLSKPREALIPEIGWGGDYYATQYEILKSGMLAKRVVKALGLASLPDFKGEFPENIFKGMIKVEPLKSTRLVRVSVDYKDPVMATKMVNVLASLYVEQNIENILYMSKEILKAFPKDAAEIERHTVYGQLKDISSEEATDSLPSVINNIVLQRLNAEKIEAETELANLNKRYKEKHPKIVALNNKLTFINDKTETEKSRILTGLKAGLAGRLQANNIRVIDYAQVPVAPITPKRMKNALMGFFFSLFLGLGIIFFMEYIDDSIKNQENVEEDLGLPYLGDFPSLKIAIPDKYERVTEIDKDTGAAEAIRNIRTNIEFSSLKDSLKTIAITSTVPKEGKSFLASFLAYAFAKNGVKTLIIDADIRRPTMHKLFDIDQKPGLVDLLVESDSLNNAIKKTTHDNLYVLPSGSRAPNPVELLGSNRINELLKELSFTFGKIIIDTPPSLTISDALVLSKATNATIIITKYGQIGKNIFSRVTGRFRAVGSKVLGVVINFTDIEKSSYYKHIYYNKYYKNYYSNEDEAAPPGKEDNKACQAS